MSHLNRHVSFTSDLRAAGETDRYRWPRSVGGGMLRLSHPIGLMDPLAPAELAVLCRARAEPRRLIVACLGEGVGLNGVMRNTSLNGSKGERLKNLRKK